MIEQKKLVELIDQEEKNRELDESERKQLSQVEKFELNSLLLKYKQMGIEFPAFNIKATRENMQRLVVKLMGLC